MDVLGRIEVGGDHPDDYVDYVVNRLNEFIIRGKICNIVFKGDCKPADRMRYVRAILAIPTRKRKYTIWFEALDGGSEAMVEMAQGLNSVQFPDDLNLIFEGKSDWHEHGVGSMEGEDEGAYPEEFFEAVRNLRNVHLDAWTAENVRGYLRVPPQPSLNRKLHITSWRPDHESDDRLLAQWIPHIHTLILRDVQPGGDVEFEGGFLATPFAIARSSLETVKFIGIRDIEFELVSFPKSLRHVHCERIPFPEGMVASLAECPLLESITLKNPIQPPRRYEEFEGYEDAPGEEGEDFPGEFRKALLGARDRSMLRKIDVTEFVDDTIVKFMEDPRNRLQVLYLFVTRWEAFERIIRSPHASRLHIFTASRINGDSSDRGKAVMRKLMQDTNIRRLRSDNHKIAPPEASIAFGGLHIVRAILSGRYIRGKASRLFQEVPWEDHIRNIAANLWGDLTILANAEFVRDNGGLFE